MSKLTHINSNGEAQMVDVSDKENTMREAKAGARVVMQSNTLELIVSGSHKKGDVLSVAKIAGIQAANSANMISIGIGEEDILNEADYVFSDFTKMNNDFLNELIKRSSLYFFTRFSNKLM